MNLSQPSMHKQHKNAIVLWLLRVTNNLDSWILCNFILLPELTTRQNPSLVLGFLETALHHK